MTDVNRFTFVLIPGAGGDAWYWHLVLPKLQDAGHDAVAVSLPAADEGAGLAEYASATIRAVGNHDPARVVLVAQSLAGFTAPMVCDRVGGASIVLVNAMIPKPGETPGEWWQNTRHAEAKRTPFDPLEDFFHDVPPPLKDAAFARGEPRQSGAVFQSRCAITAWPSVPTRVLVGRDDRFFPIAFQRAVARERLGLEVDAMPGGHLVAFSQPTELAARLIAYLSALR
jgi:pimeloyl-ACP methyl ester carboxylesterase